MCVGGQFAWEALKPGAVGHGSPGELLVGPLSVLLLGGFGVLLARLVTAPFAAPLLIVLLLFLATFLGFSDDGWTRWLMPSVGTYSVVTLPSDLIGRPAAWHALYLGGLALTLMTAAVLLSGGARLRTAQAAVACAVALTLAGAVGQSGACRSPSPRPAYGPRSPRRRSTPASNATPPRTAPSPSGGRAPATGPGPSATSAPWPAATRRTAPWSYGSGSRRATAWTPTRPSHRSPVPAR